MISRVLLLAFIAGPLATTSGFSTPQASQPPENATLGPVENGDSGPVRRASRDDREFVEDVLKITHNETVIARLVAERAITREVGDLARQLIADLDAAAEELRTLAKKKRIVPPAPRSKAGDLKTWNEKAPAELDAEYLERVKGVLDDLAKLYEQASRSADPEIAGFGRKLLAAVREQQKRAETSSPNPADQPPPSAPERRAE